MTHRTDRVNVLTPLPIDKALTYRWQGREEALLGTLVNVEVGRRHVTGCVWTIEEESHLKDDKLKEAHGIEQIPRFNENFLSFLQWMAHWSYNPQGLILKMALGASRHVRWDRLLAKKEASVVAHHLWNLTDSQKIATKKIVDKDKGVILLDGVTGSGKTLVYMEAMADHLEKEGQLLVLLPEIALLPQWLATFRYRFGFEPCQWHSDLTKKKREETWIACASGHARVLVGTRSALFLPLPRLSLLIVDEEHDASYKQEQGVIYHGRDMAVARAHFEKIPIVLASATPSLETLSHVASGKYESAKLEDRFKGTYATIRTIDMRLENNSDKSNRFISAPLERAMRAMREKNRQCLLFVNRRGYAPLTLCRDCGHRLTGPKCDNGLVWHPLQRRLLCHYCGYEMKMPDKCPDCGEDGLILYGMGVDRLEQEVRSLFDGEIIRVISSDRMAKKGVLEQTLQELRDGTIGIAIGTQMIAKGHHFPHLGLVGVVDADMGLASDDIRASERCYQMLHQVGGRAGREDEDGVIYIQTHQPDHAVMKALCSYDRDEFVSLELTARKNFSMPPYGRLAALIVSGKNGEMVESVMRQLVADAPLHDAIRLYGPVPAPIFIIGGRKRWRLLVSAGSPKISLSPYIRSWLGGKIFPSSVKLEVDIDPINFL